MEALVAVTSKIPGPGLSGKGSGEEAAGGAGRPEGPSRGRLWPLGEPGSQAVAVWPWAGCSPLCASVSSCKDGAGPTLGPSALTAYEVIRTSVVLRAGTQGQALGSVLHAHKLINSSRPPCPLGPHLTSEETEALRGGDRCPRSHMEDGAGI